MTLDEAIEIIKRDSRRYAKRQLTWFRRYEDAKWFEIDKFDSAEELKDAKRDSRRYAKRQLTWFRRYEDAKWFEIDKFDSAEELKDAVVSYVKEML